MGDHAAAMKKRAVGGGQWAAMFGALLLALPGCVTTSSFVDMMPGQQAQVYKVAVAWNPEVVFTPDPVHGGEPVPGIAGRVYLFGEDIKEPIPGDGGVVVQLYDSRTKDKDARPLEEWRIDAQTLKRLKRRDVVGWGYTLFLPWGSYQPEINRVTLRLRYQPPKGMPLYADSTPVTLGKGTYAKMQISQATTVVGPAGRSPENSAKPQ
jgi:hypothetical protein